LLYRYLPSTGEASGPLAGLAVKFGGAFAGYLVVFLVLAYIAKRIIVAREARHMRPDAAEHSVTGGEHSQDGMGD
jgi:flagellar biosynthesis/type III secretory pathway M-ring protein FliF/YscJ